MKYSLLFGKTKKDISKDAVSINHQLLIKAGFIDQLSAGVFTWLPLGLRVLRRIDQVIREELDAVGCQEILMPGLIQKSNWEMSKRWENADVLFKTKSQTGKEYGLGFSHEEVVSPMAAEFISSYKDLPIALYQIQIKFRDELRAKSGLLRGREFGTKDLYSFHADNEDLKKFYDEIKTAYLKIFARLGLKQVKITEASGGTFTKKHSHEFNVLTPAGEVDLLYCVKCTFAHNVEITDEKEGNSCPACKKGLLKGGKAIEVGNIFDLGTKFAEDFGVNFMDKDGIKKPAVMGCYGIGNTRLVGTIVELFHDDKGIIWPVSVAPYKYHLISLPGGEEMGQQVYEKLTKSGTEILWDDREISAGYKFADCDLIGIPYRLVVSQKTAGKIEIKKRNEKEIKLISPDELKSI